MITWLKNTEFYGIETFNLGIATSSIGNPIGRLGDLVDFTSLPDHLMRQEILNPLSVHLNLSYFETCGSPAEVGNDPSKGNLLKFYTVYDSFVTNDKFLGGPTDDHLSYFESEIFEKQQQLVKATVWLRMALEAADQLRQRMAWALHQHFVASSLEVGTQQTESWLA